MRSSNRPGVLPDVALGSSASLWAPDDMASLGWAGPAVDRAESKFDAAERERHEIEQRVEQVRAEAYASGLSDGAIAEATRLRSAVTAIELGLDTIRTSEAKWQECVTENIAALAITVARHIVGRELASDASTFADLVKRALAEFPIDQPMRVRVNPHDLSLLSLPTSDAGAPVPIAPNRDVRWLADERIQPGGCVVEGRERIVDGRVDTALERLYRKLSDNNA